MKMKSIGVGVGALLLTVGVLLLTLGWGMTRYVTTKIEVLHPLMQSNPPPLMMMQQKDKERREAWKSNEDIYIGGIALMAIGAGVSATSTVLLLRKPRE